MRLVSSGHRSAFTLIEVLLLMTLSMTLLGGTIMLMNLVRRSDAKSNHSLLARQEIRRFADELRRDVAICSKLSMGDNALIVLDDASKTTTVYKPNSTLKLIERSIRDSSGNPMSGDVYQIDALAEVMTEIENQSEFVRWSIERLDSSYPVMEIVAVRRIP